MITAQIKKRLSLTKVPTKDNLALTLQVGTSFSWKMISKEEFVNVVLNILVKFKWTLFLLLFRAKIYYAKLNQEWVKLQFSLSPFLIRWMQLMVSINLIKQLLLAILVNLLIRFLRTLRELVVTLKILKFASVAIMEANHLKTMRNS